MQPSKFVAWDIGGAHLKVACINDCGKLEWVEQIATPLWQGLDCLKTAIPALIEKLPQGKLSHAITMTAELVDIFESRNAGMRTLIKLCVDALGDNINFYAAPTGFLNMGAIGKNLHQIASANWYASTTYVATFIESGVFIDVGSTTTDIIAIADNKINNRGIDDQSRLRFDELVYTGVIRTSLMSLTEKAPFGGEWQNLAMEHFANTADIYRILEYINDNDDLMATADGNAKDIIGSRRRLARMLGLDFSDHANQAWYKLAQYFAEIQLQLLTKATLRVLTNTHDKQQIIVGAGVGRFLVKQIAQRLNIPYSDFSALCNSSLTLADKCNACAPAVALAQLSRLSSSA